jgi:flagellar motor switch protein FliN/FliY
MTNNADDKSTLDQELSDLGSADQSLEALFAEEENQQGENPEPPRSSPARDIAMFSKIPVSLSLEVDTVEVMLGDLLDLEPGEVLPLDKKTGQPLDVKVNGQLLATAEVVVVDGRYGLRLLEIVDNPKVTGQG